MMKNHSKVQGVLAFTKGDESDGNARLILNPQVTVSYHTTCVGALFVGEMATLNHESYTQ